MNYFPLTKEQQDWQERAAETDRTGQYPKECLDALKQAGLFGLRVSKEHGGLGERMLTNMVRKAHHERTVPRSS